MNKRPPGGVNNNFPDVVGNLDRTPNVFKEEQVELFYRLVDFILDTELDEDAQIDVSPAELADKSLIFASCQVAIDSFKYSTPGCSERLSTVMHKLNRSSKKTAPPDILPKVVHKRNESNYLPRHPLSDTVKAAGACKGLPQELFFGGGQAEEEVAKQTCDKCPVRLECLEVALFSNERGIWGGTTDEERTEIKVERVRLSVQAS